MKKIVLTEHIGTVRIKQKEKREKRNVCNKQQQRQQQQQQQQQQQNHQHVLNVLCYLVLGVSVCHCNEKMPYF